MSGITNLRRRIAESVRRNPRLWTLLNPWYQSLRHAINEFRLRRSCGEELIQDQSKGNDAVRAVLAAGRPAAIGKVGSLEAEALGCFLNGRDYDKILSQQLLVNVGIHPADRPHLDAFCETFLRAADDLDLLAVRAYAGELEIVKRVGSRPLVRERAFEPWWHANPWSEALGGKRVLVVTPFAESVMEQFAHRERIWRNPRMLPPFDLRVVRMPLSPGLVPTTQKDWQERLASVIAECDQAPYDIMLVGAGGLSLPLVSHAKASGRIGFHLGGHTQILFGVTGRRWDNDLALNELKGEAWVRPSGAEAPPTVVKVEQGAYW